MDASKPGSDETRSSSGASPDKTQVGTAPMDPTKTLPPGRIVIRRIGKYDLTGRIGIGALGQVWLGDHPELDIPIAVKILNSDVVIKHPDYIARFEAESKTAARINHPSVVRVYDAGCDNGEYYIVMEHVSGGTLKREMQQQQEPINADRALDTVIQIAEGLQAASVYGIIHRDIKPANIMLDEKGRAKLADLGFAKRLHDASSSTTLSGYSLGTPTYMAPEQALDSRKVDVRSDIYALGATFYHMVTGEAPYPTNNAVELIQRHLESPVPDPLKVNPSIPVGIAATIQRMMAKSPSDRFQTPAELIHELRRQKMRLKGVREQFLGASKAISRAFRYHLSPGQQAMIYAIVIATILGIAGISAATAWFFATR